MRVRSFCAATAVLLMLAPGWVAAQQSGPGDPAGGPPMSAIDWLSESVAEPLPVALPPAAPDEPATADAIGSNDVEVTPLGQVTPDAAGLLPASVTGLVPGLWGPTAAGDLGRMIRAERTDMVPALQALLMRLLLAELDPPFDSDARGLLFLARIDKLLDMGALEQAAALIGQVGPAATPEIFRRAFDVALLLGQEDAACRVLMANPDLAPTYPARIFCQARSGDWQTAVLTLGTARALGFLDEHQDALLSRFLDPDVFEGEAMPRAAGPITPLDFRLYEAIGEALPTLPLPRAFAVADLGPSAGWKAQIEAAERLVRNGALGHETLFGLYLLNPAAPSGGVWDRVGAVAALERALEGGDPAIVGPALTLAWQRMAEAELEPALAERVAPRLGALVLPGEAAAVAFRLRLLSADYEAAALVHQPADAAERFLVALAQGQLSGVATPDPATLAVAEGFLARGAPPRVASLIGDGRIGEAILRAMDLVTLGATGELDELSDGLATLRALGFEATARRAALEVLILDRRG